MYLWIKAAFQHFFNNVQKDPVVQVQGLRACRQLLAYLLREIGIQRQRLLDGQPVDDTMLTRLAAVSAGSFRAERAPARPTSIRGSSAICASPRTSWGPSSAPLPARKRRRAGSSIRSSGCRRASIERRGLRATATAALPRPRELARQRPERHERERKSRRAAQVFSGSPCGCSRKAKCCSASARETGAQIAGSRPLAAGTLVFASHGSAMKDVPEPDAFILDRPREHYLQYGWSRHTCLGQYVSPVIIVESMIALLGLQDLAAPGAASGRVVVPVRASLRPSPARRPESLHHHVLPAVRGLRHDATLLAARFRS